MYTIIDYQIRKLGIAYVAQFSSGKTISFSLKAPNKILEQSATLGNARRYYQFNSSDWALVDAQDEAKPIMNSFGALSAVPDYFIDYTGPGSGRARVFIENNAILKKAVLADSKIVLGVVNSPWGVNEYINVTEASRTINAFNGGDDVTVNIPSQYIKCFFVGMKVEGKFVSTAYFIGNEYIAVDYVNSTATINFTGGAPPTIAQIRVASVQVFTRDVDGLRALRTSSDSGVVELVHESTTNGQTLVSLQTLGGGIPPSSSNTEYYFILVNKTTVGHSDFNETLLNSVGLIVDATEFSDAQSEIDQDVQISISQLDEIESVRTILQRVVNSVNGIIYANDQTDEYGYKIVNENLSAIDWTVTEVDILEPDLVPKQEYQDTASNITMTNPVVLSSNYIPNSNSSSNSTFAAAFNRETKVKNFESYIEETNLAITYKANNNNTPKTFYSFTLKPDNFYDMQIGDLVRIDNVNGRLVNLASTVDLIIMEISKSAEILRVKGYEFQKVP